MIFIQGCVTIRHSNSHQFFSIDATRESGRLGRLVNHSRLHPNLQTKVVMVKESPRLILIAKTEVSEGEVS